MDQADTGRMTKWITFVRKRMDEQIREVDMKASLEYEDTKKKILTEKERSIFGERTQEEVKIRNKNLALRTKDVEKARTALVNKYSSIISDIKNTLKTEVAKNYKEDTFRSLAKEALKALNVEKNGNITVKCLKKDTTAAKEFFSAVDGLEFELQTMDNKECGGVIISYKKATCINTLSSKLERYFKQHIPEIRNYFSAKNTD